MHSSVLRRGLEWLGGSWLVWLAMVSCSAGASPEPGATGTPPSEFETGGTLATTGGIAEGAGGLPSLSGGATSSPTTGGRSAPAATGGGGSYVPPVMAQPMPAAPAITYERVERPCDKTFEYSGVPIPYATLPMPGSSLTERAMLLVITAHQYASLSGMEGQVNGAMIGADSATWTCATGQTTVTFLVPKL